MQRNEDGGKNRFGLVTYEYLKETKALARKIESLDSQITKQRQKVGVAGFGKEFRLSNRYGKKLTDLENQKRAAEIDLNQRRVVIRAWLANLGSEWGEDLKTACFKYYVENESVSAMETQGITNICSRTREFFDRKYW